MAKRRMLSIDFCESDHFYMLSPVSRMLYVHFVLNADDDGFVDKWRSVMRCSRIERKFYKPLVDLGYIIEINEGLILIADWHRHNTIRADRYIATAYSKVLRDFSVDEDKRYIKASEAVLVNQCEPQSRIDKNRIDKSREDKIREEKDKNSGFTTNSHSYTHTVSASQNDEESGQSIFLISQAARSAISLYFMKEYQTIDFKDFFDECESVGWVGDKGESIIDNYKKYVDRFMEKK